MAVDRAVGGRDVEKDVVVCDNNVDECRKKDLDSRSRTRREERIAMVIDEQTASIELSDKEHHRCVEMRCFVHVPSNYEHVRK